MYLFEPDPCILTYRPRSTSLSPTETTHIFQRDPALSTWAPRPILRDPSLHPVLDYDLPGRSYTTNTNNPCLTCAPVPQREATDLIRHEHLCTPGLHRPHLSNIVLPTVTNSCSPTPTCKPWINTPEPESCSKDFTCRIQVYIPLAPKFLLESHIYPPVSNFGPGGSYKSHNALPDLEGLCTLML